MNTLAQRQLSTALRQQGQSPNGIYRLFTSGLWLYSGHSRWSKIKHDKGKEDAVKSKQRAILVHELTNASKQHGPDPLFNAKLASLITTAKKSGLAKMSIETAIARGQGASLNGDALEGVTFEVMMKPAVAFIIECQTDNKARTTQEIRDVFKEFKATATPTTYMFEKKGRVILEKLQAVNDERILEQALEAGALDVISEENGKSVTIMTDPIDTTTVAKSMTAALPLEVESLDIIWEAREDMKASIDSTDESERIESFINRLQDNVAVQVVYINANSIC